MNAAVTVAARPEQVRRELSPEAIAVASEQLPRPYSPVVVTGLAQFIEFCLIFAIGFVGYVLYVLPGNSFHWYYPAAILAVAAASVIGFQIAGIYRLQSFRSAVRQHARLIGVWTLVFLLLGASIFLA